MSKKIIFKINREGEVLIDKLTGYGKGCKEITKILADALGEVDESTRKLTEEYDKPVETNAGEHVSH